MSDDDRGELPEAPDAYPVTEPPERFSGDYPEPGVALGDVDPDAP